MITWPVKCALFAAVLQCIGCSADTAGTDATGLREAGTAVEVARSDGNASAPHEPLLASAPLPTSASVVAAPDPNTSPYLVTESAFIEGAGISSERSDPVLESGALFSNALRRMSEDASRSMEAQDLAMHYRNALERAVGAQGTVEDLACGLSLCMGAVSARSRADHEAWAERLYEDADAARHVTLDVFEMNGDRLQNRFLFSADTAIKAIVLPPKRDR